MVNLNSFDYQLNSRFEPKKCMPLSYQNIGFTFILLMVGCLMVNELVKYLKEHFGKSKRISD